jgi:DNA replication protein DnaC
MYFPPIFSSYQRDYSFKEWVIFIPAFLGQLYVGCDNVIMIGNPGTGKTHLAIGLGRRLCSQGFKVRYATASSLATKVGRSSRRSNPETVRKNLAQSGSPYS